MRKVILLLFPQELLTASVRCALYNAPLSPSGAASTRYAERPVPCSREADENVAAIATSLSSRTSGSQLPLTIQFGQTPSLLFLDPFLSSSLPACRCLLQPLSPHKASSRRSVDRYGQRWNLLSTTSSALSLTVFCFSLCWATIAQVTLSPLVLYLSRETAYSWSKYMIMVGLAHPL